jgi:predicted flap endonuclease-1-like 5' DNA nuclease
LALFWQIVIFLLVAAALGFVIGWVTRGSRAHGGMAAGLADEPDHLRAELAAAREAQGRLETSLAETRELADSRDSRARGLEQALESGRERIARLEQELSEARAASTRQVSSVEAATALAPPPAEPVQGTPPPALASPEGEPDDLKKISGIGPGIEKTLHGLGIYHFRQIAQFTPDNVLWIDQRLRFKGRIEREDWIGQARKLAAGEIADRA